MTQDEERRVRELEETLEQLAGPIGPPPGTAEPPAPPAPSTVTPPTGPFALPAFSAETLTGLIEAVPDALVVVDQTGRIVLINGQTEEMFGYKRDELVGQWIEALVPERLRGGHVAQRDEYFAAPCVLPLARGKDLFGRRKDGHEIPVEISLSPLHTSGGLLVVATVRDVSERRAAVEQLRKMEARYRTLVEGIPAVTLMAPMDEAPGRGELYVSPQIEQLLGFSQREWVENPILWYTQLHPDDQQKWHEEFAQTVSSGKPFRSVYRFISRDGRVVWVQGEAKVERDDVGRPLFLQGVAFDITGIKEAEEELRELNATLDQKVAERTEELQRSNKELDRFARVLVHDMRTPVLGFNELLRRVNEKFADGLEEDGRKKLRQAHAQGLLLEAKIKAVADYSAVRTEAKPPVRVSCFAALDVAKEELKEVIDQAKAKIISGDSPTVIADRAQLVRLFQNLIGNSLKYRSADPPLIRVTARPEREGWWVIEVTDNGIGIEPQYCQNIFRFGKESRVHSTLDAYCHITGSGIGLSTCEEIVQRHGGCIWADSEGLGKGTRISFTLPAAPG